MLCYDFPGKSENRLTMHFVSEILCCHSDGNNKGENNFQNWNFFYRKNPHIHMISDNSSNSRSFTIGFFDIL